MNTLFWTAVAFLCGSLPLSYWLGRIALHTDIRAYGDGNPGATNVWRAGGPGWGLLAVFLDFGKGLAPVAAARLFGVDGWALVPVALAPVIGHAYTPFLQFQGGKALAVTFGIWTGLTAWEVPTVLGLAFAFWLALLAVEGWAVLCGMLTLLAYLLVTGAEAYLLVVWAGTFLLFVWKHRVDFHRRPRPNKGILRPLFRK